MTDRSENSIPISSGYSIDLYCWICHNTDEVSMDGPTSYYTCRAKARKRGWILHKDGYATCPNCNTKKKNNKP